MKTLKIHPISFVITFEDASFSDVPLRVYSDGSAFLGDEEEPFHIAIPDLHEFATALLNVAQDQRTD